MRTGHSMVQKRKSVLSGMHSARQKCIQEDFFLNKFDILTRTLSTMRDILIIESRLNRRFYRQYFRVKPNLMDNFFTQVSFDIAPEELSCIFNDKKYLADYCDMAGKWRHSFGQKTGSMTNRGFPSKTRQAAGLAIRQFPDMLYGNEVPGRALPGEGIIHFRRCLHDQGRTGEIRRPRRPQSLCGGEREGL
jgi:hypothetical protein